MTALHYDNLTEGRDHFRDLLDAAEVVHEAGSWWVFMPGLPISADGATFDEAVDKMVGELRDYAEDWRGHLSAAPNHEGNRGLVRLVELSSDAQLVDWLRGAAS